MKRLNDMDIQNLYDEFDTPEHVKAHCRGVTSCALKLADALMIANPDLHLDKELIYGAGMTHDCARKLNPHELFAANRLEELGFKDEAEIVRNHMHTMTYNAIDQVTEADLLYISDRMVLEDTFVGPEKRYEYLIEKMIKFGRNPNSEDAKANRLNSFKFVKAIEEKTGLSIFDICKEE